LLGEPRRRDAEERHANHHRPQAELKPESSFDGSDNGHCDCDFCLGWRAARALQNGYANCRNVVSLGPDLQRLIAAWDGLPEAIRKAAIASIE
jgi:hypothetical protein